MGYVKGHDLRVYMRSARGDYVPTAYARSCELSVTRDTEENSDRLSGRFKTRRPGRIDWGMSSDGLATDKVNMDIFEALVRGEPVRVVFSVGGSAPSEVGYAGYAYVTGLSLAAEYTDIAVYSISLEGTGELERFSYAVESEWFLRDGVFDAYGYWLRDGKFDY